jgi:hypothetical protein
VEGPVASGSYVLEWLVTGALALAAAKPAWTALRGVRRDVERARVEARDEYEVRVCARLAAAERNLLDAAAWIGAREPGLRARARQVAAKAARRLEDRYAAGVAREAAGECRSGRLVTALRREGTPGRDATWPNWVVEFRVPER